MISEGQERNEEKETGRLEAFSDGVFAVAITLLIFQIPAPKGDSLLQQLGGQWPFYAAYVVSFLTILIMWVNHHALFRLIHRTDRLFLMLNGLLLMLITFVNYPTAVLAEYIQQQENGRIAAMLYSGTFVITAILYNLLWRYASANHRLLSKRADSVLVATITKQYRFGPLYYLIAFLLAIVYAPASLAANMLLALYFVFTGRAKSPKDALPAK